MVSATGSATGPVIEVRGLVKSYGDVEAVRGIDLEVGRGEVFALLGPNGAGKTTTTEILEGFRTRTSGEVTVLGHDPAHRSRELRSQVGIVLQSTGNDPYLTVEETIEMYGGFYPKRRPTDEVIELVGLAEKRDTRVIKLSGGQQRRLDVAVALAGDPDLLFLDEPTTGFDPSARRGAWEVIANLAALDTTVFLTTHFMDEAQVLADRVAVIAGGVMVAEGTPETLAGRNRMRTRVRFRLPEGAEVPRDAQRLGNGRLEVEVDEPTQALHDLTAWALSRDLVLEGITVDRPSLEDIYLEITGETHAEQGSEPANESGEDA